MKRREFCRCTLLAAGMALAGGLPWPAHAAGDKDQFQLKFELSRAGSDRLETLVMTLDEGKKGKVAIPGTVDAFVQVSLQREKGGPVDFFFLLLSPEQPDAKPVKQVLKRGSPPPEFTFQLGGKSMSLRLVSLKATVSADAPAAKKCKKCKGTKVCQACEGAKKRICGSCHGSGEGYDGACTACGGKGHLGKCSMCSGSGKCYFCGGTGLAP